MTDTATPVPTDSFAPFDWRGFIAFPADVDVAKIVQTVYARSQPRGLGMLHFQAGPLEAARVADVIASAQARFEQDQKSRRTDYSGDPRESKATFLDFDYVDGRCVKFRLYRDLNTNAFFTDVEWYDHGDYDVLDLVSATFNLGDDAAQAVLDDAKLAKLAKATDEFNAKAVKALPFLREIQAAGGTITLKRDVYGEGDDRYKALTAKPNIEYAYDLDNNPLFRTKYDYDAGTVTFGIDVGGDKLLAAEVVSA